MANDILENFKKNVMTETINILTMYRFCIKM